MNADRADHRTARLRNATLLFVAAAGILFYTLPEEWGEPLAGGSLLIAFFFGRQWLLTGQSHARTSKPPTAQTNELRDAVLLSGLYAAGFIRLPTRLGTSCGLHLPENVADQFPPDATKTVASLWQWQHPTGGFPVQSTGP